MGVLLAVVLIFFTAATVRILLVTPPERLAAFLRNAVPVLLIGAGVILTFIGRGALGIPLVGFGLAAYQRSRRKAPARPLGDGPATSQVRSAFLDMTLDYDSGDLDGTVTRGRDQGRTLSAMSPDALRTLRSELTVDEDSLRLLEAYLDRRIPGWRLNAKGEAADGLGSAPSSGPMTEQQAYQILGLQPGATIADIRHAHRRLMKRVHPDHGGTDFLAARINEAKAFLIERHR